MLDPVAAERGEREFDRLIERAARGSRSRDKANALAEAWAASERRVLEKQRQENRILWGEFHLRLADSHTRIAEENRLKAEALLAEPGAPGASR